MCLFFTKTESSETIADAQGSMRVGRLRDAIGQVDVPVSAVGHSQLRSECGMPSAGRGKEFVFGRIVRHANSGTDARRKTRVAMPNVSSGERGYKRTSRHVIFNPIGRRQIEQFECAGCINPIGLLGHLGAEAFCLQLRTDLHLFVDRFICRDIETDGTVSIGTTSEIKWPREPQGGMNSGLCHARGG